MTDVEWPWQYNFPPFFTIQPHGDTRARQLQAWRSLVLQYQKSVHQSSLDVREAQESPLFNNTSISLICSKVASKVFNSVDRKLSISPYSESGKLPIEGIQLILEDLARTGNAEPFDKTKNRWNVYWRTLEEWAKVIYNWAVNSGSTNTVCTLYELVEGDNTTGEDFHGLDQDVLLRALKVLQSQKKAEIIMFGDNQGVKFF